jgi:hypothetical protein
MRWGLNWGWVFGCGDGDRNYFMTILAAHQEALVSEQVSA